MIYTITFNPALDYIVHTEHLSMGNINKIKKEQIFAGGKGINVSIVLENLGFDSVASGFIAGFTGEEIERQLKERGIQTRFIRLEKGMSRINIKLKSEFETEINGQGPEVTQDAIEVLERQMDDLQEGDYLVISGSTPALMCDSIYGNILESLQGRGVNVTVDATKGLLLNALKYRPFLIKPNKSELEEFFDVTLYNKRDVVEYAEKLKERGARNVLVSLGADGAVLLAEDGKIYERKAPDGKVINSVGAGDSMVAGFIAGYIKDGSYDEALKLGIAAGSACAFLDGLATKEEIMEIYHSLD
ncbi:MAG: 1-phosphofructokinase [Lachnospiraceae bacterium]|nr:1-phosphofructokinase [Lachnospiraceae bacterium]